MSIGVATEEGVAYITIGIGGEDEPQFTIGFTVPEALGVVKTLNDAIVQALASQKPLVN